MNHLPRFNQFTVPVNARWMVPWFWRRVSYDAPETRLSFESSVSTSSASTSKSASTTAKKNKDLVDDDDDDEGKGGKDGVWTVLELEENRRTRTKRITM